MTMRSVISRLAGAGAVSLLLASCAMPVGGRPAGPINPPATNPHPGIGDQAGLDRWVMSFRPRALAAGIQPATFDRAMATARYNPEVIRLDGHQAEFTKPVWEYLDGAVSDNRITTGRQKATQLASTLSAIESRYGVPREVVLAVWGMESNFGANRGRMPIVPSLATLAYDGRRSGFFEEQLVAALRIIQAGDVDAAHMVGSWAGAMGHTQFMPTSFLTHAVDFNRDGRRDIWSDDPTDALASTAAYLARAGWQRGVPWAVEVRLPAGFDFGQVGKAVRKPGAQWAAMGVSRIGGGALPGFNGSILAPTGARGPAFLISDNFRAISQYNNSDSYVLGVGLLADRIAGRAGVQGAWPRNDAQLTGPQRSEIQRRLNALGYDAGEVDGKFGSRTTEAIKAFQRARGVVPDGYATPALLVLLRQ